MLPKDILQPLLLLFSVLATGKAFLLPLLFPVSIKISIHSNHKHPPPPKPDYHFVPVYKEVVVKGHQHNHGGYHQDSYADGNKYGTSYGDGHAKVYTNEPHVKKHVFADGYSSGSHYPSTGYSDHHDDKKSTYIEGSLHISTGSHHKGSPLQIKIRTHKSTPYDDSHSYKETPLVDGHYKGTPLVDGHYKGTPVVDGHYKGTPIDNGHYKGTPIDNGHYKGTPIENGHYKGTSIDNGHYKGTALVDGYQGTEYVEAPEGHYPTYDQYNTNKPYNYIKSVGSYKLSDYLPTKQPEYDSQPEYVSHVAVPPQVAPGHTYADIQASHKVSHSPKAYDAKQYEDLGDYRQQDKYNDEAYLDDSLPAYKYGPTVYADRSGKSAPKPTEPTSYAGFGTSIYGDSYAKVTYEPRKKNLKISLRGYRN